VRLPEISLPTVTPGLPVERLRTGVASRHDETVHTATWRGLLQDFADSYTHPSTGSGFSEGAVWYGLSLDDGLDGCKRSVAKLALHGWGEAADATRAMFRQVTAQHTSTFLQTVTPTDEPGDVDVGAYLADAELQFTSATPSRQTTIGNGGVVTLEHEIFSSSNVASSDIVMRGVFVAAAVYMLERAGVRCEVIVRLTGTGMRSRDHRIKVKEAADGMHVGRLLYWLAHPSVHRVVLFSVRERFWSEQSYCPRFNIAPIAPHHITTPGQVSGTNLEMWLSETLRKVGLTFK